MNKEQQEIEYLKAKIKADEEKAQFFLKKAKEKKIQADRNEAEIVKTMQELAEREKEKARLTEEYERLKRELNIKD